MLPRGFAISSDSLYSVSDQPDPTPLIPPIENPALGLKPIPNPSISKLKNNS
jgi:hypothetical protein